jgi:hypothetical protein
VSNTLLITFTGLAAYVARRFVDCAATRASFTPFWYSCTHVSMLALSEITAWLLISIVNTCTVSRSAGSVPGSGVHISTLCGAAPYVTYVAAE